MAMLTLERPGPTATAVESIRKLFPPDFLLHVGAGRGIGPLAHWRQWGLDHVLVIDADPSRLVWVEAAADGRNWKTISAVLAANSGLIAWHEVSDSDESGLLSAVDLAGLWPDLITTSQQEQSAVTLDDLLRELQVNYGCAWLLIECIPALPILQGAPNLLECVDVAWVRVIVGDASPEAASLCAVQRQLVSLGFVLIDLSLSSHPTLGYALFVKNRVPVLLQKIEILEAEVAAQQISLASSHSQEGLLAGAKKLIKQLELQLKEKELRQQLLNEQIAAAEAQISFIKDVLFKESGF